MANQDKINWSLDQTIYGNRSTKKPVQHLERDGYAIVLVERLRISKTEVENIPERLTSSYKNLILEIVI